MPSSWRSDLLAIHEWTGYAKNGDSRFEEGQEMKLQAAARTALIVAAMPARRASLRSQLHFISLNDGYRSS
jgi:hypothetical protein